MRDASPPSEVGSTWPTVYATKYVRVSQRNGASIPRACNRRCQRHAIGATEPTMIATDAPKYTQSAWRSSRSARPRSICQTMYAAQSPVTASVRRDLDQRRCIDRLEADQPGRVRRTVERVLLPVAHGEHRTRAVGRPSHVAEDVTRPAVDADPAHTVECVRLLESGHVTQLPAGREQEADAHAADALRRRELLRVNVLSERRAHCECVEVDPERLAAELGVVRAAETRRDPHDARVAVREHEPRSHRTGRDSERAHGSRGRLEPERRR